MLLPEPEGPISPTTSPGATVHVDALQGIDRGIALAIAFAQAFDANAETVHLSLQSLRPGRHAGPARIASVLASAQITHHGDKAAQGVARYRARRTWETRAPTRWLLILPTTKADQAQAERLLQNHPGDRPVACTDELEHRDLADLAHGHGVDDEGDDGRADHGQDDQEHADLAGPRWRSACRPGSLPSARGCRPCRCFQRRIDFWPPRSAAVARLRPVTSTAFTLRLALCEAMHGVQQARHAGTIERRIGRRCVAGSLQNGVVVLEELGLLGILERDEYHRVAARGHHAPRQANDGVIVTANARCCSPRRKPVARSATAS